MPAPLSGPGLGLPLPQNLFPSELNNAPYDASSSRITLAPGGIMAVPAGDWYITLGMYLVLQYQDPITNAWITSASGGWQTGVTFVKSDGFTCRIANLTGCVVGAVVTSYGSNYVAASTTVTVTGPTGVSITPFVGGQLTLVGATLTSNGAGYGVAPIVMIPPPPPGTGIPASGYCTIANGTVSGFTFTNPGAGYTTAPSPVVVPSQFDPNLSTGITAATMAFSLTGSGSITGALVVNNGQPLATVANVTLAVAGAGTNATLVPVVMQTVTAASVTGQGTGYGTVAALLTSVGGAPSAGTITNGPDFLNLAFKPRPLQAQLTITNLGTLATQLGTILDGGLFENTPTAVIVPSQMSGSVAGASVALTMGSKPDIAILQPAP